MAKKQTKGQRKSRVKTLANQSMNHVPQQKLARRVRGSQGKLKKYGLDAFQDFHVPLPRAVAPYLVVRTVRAFSTNDPFIMFGTSKVLNGGSSHGEWNNVIAHSNPDGTNALAGADWKRWTVGIPGIEAGGMMECVPAAYSVQVMNDSALQSASGVFYMGRAKGTIDAPESTDTRTVAEFANTLISYAPPRILTGSKLALGAVQANLTPSNLVELGDFESITSYVDNTGAAWGEAFPFSGFNPAYLWNPTSQQLQFLVAVEWRVRPSPFNPMASAVSHHPPSTDNFWNDLIKAGSDIGHGVIDLAEWLEGLL